jgi:tetratricopeptide (TPR) repeat protein
MCVLAETCTLVARVSERRAPLRTSRGQGHRGTPPPLLQRKCSALDSSELRRRRWRVGGLLFALVAGACAQGGAPSSVTPADIPALLSAARLHPRDAAVRFRLAAALAAANRCDTAVVVDHAAELLAPADALGPLVEGICAERGGRYDVAIGLYNGFLSSHPTAPGSGAVRARAHLALRAAAELTARVALANEAQLAQEPPEPHTLAVLPVVVAGDSSVQPLSRGLAELITTDLATIRDVRLLERLQVGALVDELKLSRSARTDPATAARVGRMLRAERMIQGVAQIPPKGAVQLSAAVVAGTGVVQPVRTETGPFKNLLELEKQLVFDLSAELGITLTQAERELILRQGPTSLVAFLSYSDGLDAMDHGDYQGAAQDFNAAVRVDPGFTAARDAQQTAVAAPSVQGATSSPGGLVAAAQTTTAGPTTGAAAGNALGSASGDVAPSRADLASQAAGGSSTGVSTTQRQPAAENQGVSTVVYASGFIQIIFRLPP